MSTSQREYVKESMAKPATNGGHTIFPMRCGRGVWSLKLSDRLTGELDNEVALPSLVDDRADGCFFWLFNPSMEIEVASELERRAAKGRETEKNRRQTRQAIWIACMALIISFITLVIRLAELL